MHGKVLVTQIPGVYITSIKAEQSAIAPSPCLQVILVIRFRYCHSAVAALANWMPKPCTKGRPKEQYTAWPPLSPPLLDTRFPQN